MTDALDILSRWLTAAAVVVVLVAALRVASWRVSAWWRTRRRVKEEGAR